MRCPAELYTASARPHRDLPQFSYPFHEREILVTASRRICLHRKRWTSQPPSSNKPSESPMSKTAFSSSPSCTMISAISIWSSVPYNHSTARSARGCYQCLRYSLLPMCPGWTRDSWSGRQDLNLRHSAPEPF